MRNKLFATKMCHIRNLLCHSDTAATAHIGLNYVNLAVFKHIIEFVHCAELLTRCKRNVYVIGKTSEVGSSVRCKRLFEPVDLLLFVFF